MARMFGAYLMAMYIWRFRYQIFWQHFYLVALAVFGAAAMMQFFLVPAAVSAGLIVR